MSDREALDRLLKDAATPPYSLSELPEGKPPAEDQTAALGELSPTQIAAHFNRLEEHGKLNEYLEGIEG
ncbi:MAG: hypothetical protein LBG61_02175 [Burkholderiales bacterium]|nr:hypothetical protein [Burkholderiales bacterium]